MVDANLAVLIDYENVGLDAIQRLLDQISDVGRIIIRRAYGDWSVQRNKQDQLLELGIEPIHQYHSNKSGKNSSDIRLAIEAIDLLYNSPIDTFVIVSSDSDFVPLVGKLRSSGKSVIVAGRREATSPTLIKSCDRYIFLDTEKQTAPQASQTRRRPTRRYGRQTAQSSNQEGDGRTLLLRALDASMDEAGQVVGSKLYQTMRRIEPSFDFKDFKHRAFTQFLEAHTDVIEITRPRDGSGDVVVQQASRDHITPPPVSADNEQRAAKLVDPRDVEQDASPQRAADEKPRNSRAQSSRRQSESRAQSGRRLLGSTRPSGRRSTEEPVQPVQDEKAQATVEEETQAVDAVADIPADIPAVEDKAPDSPQKEAQEAPQKPNEQPPSATDTNGTSASISWEVAVDSAWSERKAERIAGRSAASDAAKILGAPKLSASPYPTLEKLLGASTLLQLNWRREGNAIFRK